MMNKKGLVLIISLLCVLTLTSCAKSKVKTVDASVDYKSAEKLPPLNKHATGARAGADGVLIPAVREKQAPVTLDASIDQTKKGLHRLIINEKPDVAWNNLEVALDVANITIYGRNKEAGQFFVSCGDESTLTEKEKKRRIALFKPKKVTETEYCALQTSKYRRGRTVVELVDRKGESIKSSYSSELFNRILEN